MLRKSRASRTNRVKRLNVGDDQDRGGINNDQDLDMTGSSADPSITCLHSSKNITDFPVEVLISIAQLFEPKDLCNFVLSCRRIYNVIKANDTPYRQLVMRDIFHESRRTTDASPYSSFRDLCLTLYPFRWLREGIWHGNREKFGSLCVTAYNKKRGALELYSVAIQRRIAVDDFVTHKLEHREVILMHKPRRLDLLLDLQLGPLVSVNAETEPLADQSVVTLKPALRLKVTVMRCSAMTERAYRDSTSHEWWPPETVPAHDRTRNIRLSLSYRDHYKSWLPPSFDLLRVKRTPIRNLDEMADDSKKPESTANSQQQTRTNRVERLESLIEAYSRVLDKFICSGKDSRMPYQGLWVVDCGGSIGSDKFVLVHSPRDGGLEGVFLTGDSTLTRGTRAFAVDDMMRPAENAPQVDCPYRLVVEAKSYLGSYDKWIDTQLAILNDNEMINYDPKTTRAHWYYRVKITDLLKMVDEIE